MIPTGRQLKMATAGADMSQRELARTLGIRPETVNRAFRNEASAPMMRRMKAFFEEMGMVFSATNGTVIVAAPSDV